jgi:poly(glycerol-phosphate) alpha-glucosyltransferase
MLIPAATRPAAAINVLAIVPAISRAEAGVWFAARGLTEALAQRHHVHIDLAGPQRADSDALVEELRRDGVTAHPIGSVGPGFMELPIQARRVLAEQCPGVLHVHGLWRPAGAYISRLPLFKAVPRVVSPHGMLEPWALRRSAWKKRLAATLYEHRTMHGAHVLHALCEAEVASIRAYGYRGPVCVIPNGVHIPAADRPTPRPDGTDSPPQLLFLGRLDHKKGLHLLLPALARTAELHPASRDWQLQIAGFGDPDYEAVLRAQVESTGLRERVRFLGPVFGSAKDDLLASADAFVLPSYSEGLPMAILEAAAHGLPTLCTAGCNLPELFAAGAGWQISLDPAQMAQDLAAFFGLGMSQHHQMGAAARALVQQRYQWDQVAAQFEAVYAWAANTAPQPSCVILD